MNVQVRRAATLGAVSTDNAEVAGSIPASTAAVRFLDRTSAVTGSLHARLGVRPPAALVPVKARRGPARVGTADQLRR
jgi:hypothetical protein